MEREIKRKWDKWWEVILKYLMINQYRPINRPNTKLPDFKNTIYVHSLTQ